MIKKTTFFIIGFLGGLVHDDMMIGVGKRDIYMQWSRDAFASAEYSPRSSRVLFS